MGKYQKDRTPDVLKKEYMLICGNDQYAITSDMKEAEKKKDKKYRLMD